VLKYALERNSTSPTIAPSNGIPRKFGDDGAVHTMTDSCAIIS